ncbi:MAG: hypothetical protein ACI9DC_000691 [Gammaproteobacteria bacterium]
MRKTGIETTPISPFFHTSCPRANAGAVGAIVMAKSLRILSLMAFGFCAQVHGAVIDVELNRLDARGEGCGVQMVVTNGSSTAYTDFSLELVVFDKAGQIVRRTLLNVAPVRASKTTVYSFNLKDLKCEGVGEILLNDVVDCAQASGPVENCVDEVVATSRAKVNFKK